MTSRRWRRAGPTLLLAGSLGSSSCAPGALFPAVPVTPLVEVVDDAADVVAGRAVTLRYTWTAAPDFVADRPYRVFVHFLDDQGATP